jgi:ribosomal protein L21E
VQDVKKSKKSSEVANTRRKLQEFQVVHVVDAIKEESELDSKRFQGRGGSCIGLPQVLSFKTLALQTTRQKLLVLSVVHLAT